MTKVIKPLTIASSASITVQLKSVLIEQILCQMKIKFCHVLLIKKQLIVPEIPWKFQVFSRLIKTSWYFQFFKVFQVVDMVINIVNDVLQGSVLVRHTFLLMMYNSTYALQTWM